MKSLFSSLKQNLSRSRSHRVVWFVSLILVGALIVGQLRSCLPMARTLHLGVFSTSNWDVPDSSTYEVVDQVIARFERLHPGLSVSYTSGIIKDDYSSWLSDQIVQGRLPDVFMVLDEDFNMLASLGRFAILILISEAIMHLTRKPIIKAPCRRVSLMEPNMLCLTSAICG